MVRKEFAGKHNCYQFVDFYFIQQRENEKNTCIVSTAGMEKV